MALYAYVSRIWRQLGVDDNITWSYHIVMGSIPEFMQMCRPKSTN